MERFLSEVRAGRLELPLPGAGDTSGRWLRLIELGREDPVLARLGEGHADARAILAELGAPAPHAGSVWGVWAAVPAAVAATRTVEGWRLDGDRPWCSGAGVCSHALVTAAAQDGPRLFTVAVRAPHAVAVPDSWPAVGMARSDSRTVRFVGAPALPVGGPGDYVDRPGFWFGGMGVAACWYGAASGIAATLREASRHRDLDPHALAHLGAVDAALAGAAALLRAAASTVDEQPKESMPRLARQVRAVVETTAVETMDRVGRALGAGPLCLDPAHAHRVADLTVYIRQSHAERDLAELGRLAGEERPPW